MAQAKRRVVKEKPRSQSRGQQPFKAILYQISRLTTEVLFVISVIVGLLLLAALISYTDTDPAYTHVSTETEPKNWLGTFGAYLADILFFVFGWVAYLLPIIIWVWGRVASKSDKGGLFDLEAFLFRTLGGIVTVIGFVGLANLILPSVSEYAPGGGVLGDVVSSFFSGSFGAYLAGLLLLAFIVAGITLVTAMGWGQILKLIAATSVAAVGFIQYLFKKERFAQQDIPGDPTKHDIGYDPAFNEDNDDLPKNEMSEHELEVEQDSTGEYGNARDDIEIHTNMHERNEYYDEVVDDETSHSVSFNADNSVVDPETAYQAENSPQMHDDEVDKSDYDDNREPSQAYRYPDLANAAFIPLDIHYSSDEQSGMLAEQSFAEVTENFVESEMEEITEISRVTEELSEAAATEGSDPEERGGKRAMSPLEFAAKFKGKPSKAPKADAYKKPRIKMTAAEIEHKAREQRAREEALRARTEAVQASSVAVETTSVNKQDNQQSADAAGAINTQTDSSSQSSASYGFTVPVQLGNIAVNFDKLVQSDSPVEQPSVQAPTQTVVSETQQRSFQPVTNTPVEPVISEPQRPESIVTVPPASQTSVLKTEDGVAVGVVPQHKRPDFIRAKNRNKLSNGQLPTVSLLDEAPEQELSDEVSEERLKEKSEQLEKLLASYNIEVIVRKVSAGPVITLYEIDPAPGVKVSQINNLSKDIARGLAVMGVRVLETIPGSTHVGIEVPNHKRMTVYLREVFESREFIKQKSPLTLVLGKDIGGKSVVANLAKMPHLLVAGTTGSGKSVAVNAMLLSILFKATPHEVRLIMIDPKMLELSIYDDIPHLLTPVVTDMKEAANSLRWCVTEMERRYKLLSALKVRNIASYNEVVKEAMERGEPILDPLYKMDPTAQLMEEAPPLEALPFIVVVIDELADMMMVVGKKVEELIARLAQKARAAGIHLILATQRPSVDVITGLIKANVPTRIAFQVSSRIDSRTILDTQGAENLLGNGDMLYMPPGSGQPSRAHGAFVDDDEVVRVVDFLKSTGTPNYIQNITVNVEEEAEAAAAAEPVNDQDELYDEAVAIVTTSRKATISFLQRQLRVGFNRAARLVEDMEAAGVVSTPDNGGTREVLAPPPTEL